MRRKLYCVLLAAIAVASTACNRLDAQGRERLENARAITGGEPSAGRDKILRYGCQSCHTIPGVAGADALVGPPLLHWSRRVYIAGRMPNTPTNLIMWIQHPQQVEPGTAMPDMGVTEEDARDIAAYLYGLK